jgi:hypothetical protein
MDIDNKIKEAEERFFRSFESKRRIVYNCSSGVLNKKEEELFALFLLKNFFLWV